MGLVNSLAMEVHTVDVPKGALLPSALLLTRAHRVPFGKQKLNSATAVLKPLSLSLSPPIWVRGGVAFLMTATLWTAAAMRTHCSHGSLLPPLSSDEELQGTAAR